MIIQKKLKKLKRRERNHPYNKNYVKNITFGTILCHNSLYNKLWYKIMTKVVSKSQFLW